MEVAAAPVFRSGDGAEQEETRRAGCVRSVVRCESGDAVFVAGEVAGTVHFQTEDVASGSCPSRASERSVGCAGDLLDENVGRVFDAVVAVRCSAAAGEQDCRPGEIGGAVERGEGSLRKLCGAESVDGPVGNIVGARRANKIVRADVDPVVGHRPIGADGPVRARSVVVGAVLVAGDGDDAAAVGKRDVTSGGESARWGINRAAGESYGRRGNTLRSGHQHRWTATRHGGAWGG